MARNLRQDPQAADRLRGRDPLVKSPLLPLTDCCYHGAASLMQHKPCRTCHPAGLILYRRNRQHIEPDTGQETSAGTRSTAPADTSSSTDSRQHQSARPRQSKDRQTASNAGQIPDTGHTGHTSNNITEHNVPPRLRDGRETRHRAGHPHVSPSPAGMPTGKAAAVAALALALPGGSPAGIPPAGGVSFVSLRRGALMIYPEPSLTR